MSGIIQLRGNLQSITGGSRSSTALRLGDALNWGFLILKFSVALFHCCSAAFLLEVFVENWYLVQNKSCTSTFVRETFPRLKTATKQMRVESIADRAACS